MSTTEILAPSRRTQNILLSKETFRTAALLTNDLRYIHISEKQTKSITNTHVFISQFAIINESLADDSILSNVAVSVSEEVTWKPVAKVVFRYSST